MEPLFFVNKLVENLYKLATSSDVAKITNSYDARNTLLPHIKAVIDDSEAFEEARSKWPAFSIINDHVTYKEPLYVKMDFDTSMCVALWFYIYA
jgi:hypothetical protein